MSVHIPPVPVTDLKLHDDFFFLDTKVWDLKHYGNNDPSLCTIRKTSTSSYLDVAAKLVSGNWKTGFASAVAKPYNGPRYIEARIKFPAGLGVWSGGLWEWEAPYGNAPGIEIDVCEQLGKEPTEYHATLHNWGVGGSTLEGGQKIANPSGVALSRAFHWYGAAIYPDHVDWYFGGKKVGVPALASAEKITDLSSFEVVTNFNMQMGAWGGPISSRLTEVHMLVDTVNVWGLKL